jgi:hypothetical protein
MLLGITRASPGVVETPRVHSRLRARASAHCQKIDAESPLHRNRMMHAWSGVVSLHRLELDLERCAP